MGKQTSYYAVHRGRTPGVYKTWKECEQQTTGFPNARYKKFATESEAQMFYKSGDGGNRFNPIKNVKIQKKIDFSEEIKKRKGSITTKVKVIEQESITEEGFIKVYTDGSSRGNGNAYAKAGYGVYFGEDDPRNDYGKVTGRQTNQRAEITAALKALEISDPSVPLEINTDSRYVINAMTSWIKNWDRNGWKNSQGKDVENKDLFTSVQSLIKNRSAKVNWVYVPGHKGIHGNEMADMLANKGADLN